MTRTVTAALSVLTSPYSSLTPEDFATAPADRIASGVVFWTPECGIPEGYSLVGAGEITFTLHDRDSIIASKVEALKAEKTQTLAEAQAKATRLESQIQQLLAITHEV